VPTLPAAPPSALPPTGRTRAAAALALAALLVGGWLRCHDAASLSLNGDEIYAMWEAQSARATADASDLLGAWKTRASLMASSDPADPPGIPHDEAWRLRWGYRTNPLSLLINEAAIRLFGATPLAIRLGSLVLGLAALVVLPWLARPLLGERGALLLLLLLAFCPDVVEIARDARYKSACFLFGGVAALAAARFVRDRRPRDEWLALAACALLVLSHLTGLLAAGTLFLWLALAARGRVSLRLLPIAALVAFLAWRFGPQAKVGQVIEQGITIKGKYPWWKLALSLVYGVGPLLVALGVGSLFTMRRLGAKALLPLLAAMVVPTIALFWMNHRKEIGPRYFGAPEAAGIVLAASCAEFLFRRERGRRLAVAALALTLVSQAPLLASNWVDGQRFPWSEAARLVHERAVPGDRVVSNWSGIVEYHLKAESNDPRFVLELPNTLAGLDAALRKGEWRRAFLILPRQRGELVWPGGAARLRGWLDVHARPVDTLGRRRIDSGLARFNAGYLFELEIVEVDLEALRAQQ